MLQNQQNSTESSSVPYIGYSKITDQYLKRLKNDIYILNILIIGAHRTGKVTLLNSLFRTNFPLLNNNETKISESPEFLLEESGIKLSLRIIKCISNEVKSKDLLEYLMSQFEKEYFYEYEEKIYKRDNLIHTCLYFIEPYSQLRTLRSSDIELLKCIHDKVNVIPLLAKADSLTPKELSFHKVNLIRELSEYEIDIFEFKQLVHMTNEDSFELAKMTCRIPFGVVGSDEIKDVDGNQKLVREYPWGCVEIDNLAHCDTAALRELMLNTHLYELIETSHSIHYTNYRTDLMNQIYLESNEYSQNHPLFYLENCRKFAIHHYYKKFTLYLNNQMFKFQRTERKLKENERSLEATEACNKLSLAQLEEELEIRRKYLNELKEENIRLRSNTCELFEISTGEESEVVTRSRSNDTRRTLRNTMKLENFRDRIRRIFHRHL